MRHEEKFVPMSTQYEYVITNHTSLKDAVSDCGDYFGSPIKMTLDGWLPDNDSAMCILDLFYFQKVAGANEVFRQEYKDVLRGKSDKWKLIRTSISHKCLWFDFFNQSLYDEKNSARLGSSQRQSYYEESLTLDWPEDVTHWDAYIKISFEIQNRNQSFAEKTVVTLSNKETIIEEISERKYSEIILPGEELWRNSNLRMVQIKESYF